MKSQRESFKARKAICDYRGTTKKLKGGKVERRRILDGTDVLRRPIQPEEIISVLELNKQRPKRLHRKSHGVIGFRDLAREVARRWKILDHESLEVVKEQARIEQAKSKEKLAEWNAHMEMMEGEKGMNLQKMKDDDTNQLSTNPRNEKSLIKNVHRRVGSSTSPYIDPLQSQANLTSTTKYNMVESKRQNQSQDLREWERLQLVSKYLTGSKGSLEEGMKNNTGTHDSEIHNNFLSSRCENFRKKAATAAIDDVASFQFDSISQCLAKRNVHGHNFRLTHNKTENFDYKSLDNHQEDDFEPIPIGLVNPSTSYVPMKAAIAASAVRSKDQVVSSIKDNKNSSSSPREENSNNFLDFEPIISQYHSADDYTPCHTYNQSENDSEMQYSSNNDEKRKGVITADQYAVLSSSVSSFLDFLMTPLDSDEMDRLF